MENYKYNLIRVVRAIKGSRDISKWIHSYRKVLLDCRNTLRLKTFKKRKM